MIGSSLLAKVTKQLSAIFDKPKSDIIINVISELADNAIEENTSIQTHEEAAEQTSNILAYANNN